MKKFHVVIVLFLLTGCVKKKQEDIVINAMVQGQWKVTKFIKATDDVTSDFTNYKFQFRTNFTVDAININNGLVEKTGSWNADATTQTISSNFTNAINPVVLLNGTWHITNNSWTWVEATQIINGESWNLRLEK
jgi:hypothetical protein